MDIHVVTVIGATGAMGKNIAGIFASFGEAKVYCVGRDINRIKDTIPLIVRSVKADAIANNLIPVDYSMLERCVSESDLVFESVAENMEVKLDIANRIKNSLKSDAISCTGTSGLSITEIVACYPEPLRSHFFGVHMFNPPYNMSLCELIPTKYSDKQVSLELKEYLEKKLYRTVVETKDAPAFLGNRIGFQFINRALQYAEKYKENGGIDYIDSILGVYTGRAMAPLATADFVGLDVHKAIVNNVFDNTNDFAHDTFVLPDYVHRLVTEGKLGRKSKCGLYQRIRHDNGSTQNKVLDIKTGDYRDVINYAFPFIEKMKTSFETGDYQKGFQSLVDNDSTEAQICRSFMLFYIVYSLYVAKNVGYRVEAADDVMATGFNWCPPLAMYQAFSEVTDVRMLIKETICNECKGIDVDELLADIKPSKYDYRPFFRSGR